MKRKITLLLTCLFAMVSLVTAQVTRVSGIVTSAEDGQPVVGASVLVKGTTIGTITDIDGKFALSNVPSSAGTLLVSYVGMKSQEVRIKAKVNVVLEPDAEILDEVMVVAYGTAKKSSFTGSAAVVKSDAIEKIQTSNAVTALTGKVSGVQMAVASGQPGQTTPTIRIRGISSINAGQAPLIILDGTPYDGEMNNINSQDIESMTVLKDAASNALYGARGANGVIMITTKHGKSNSGAKVTVDAKWGSNSRATQRYKTIDSPAQYYETYYQALNNYALEQGKSAADAHLWANQNLTSATNGLSYNIYNIPDGEYMIGTNGKLNPNATMGNVVTYKGQEYLLTADDWLDEAYKNSLRQEYNVSVSNATDKSSMFASFGYLKNEGIVANSDFERLTGRLKAETQANSWLKIGGNFSYTHYRGHSVSSSEDGNSASSGNIFAIVTQVAPIFPLYMRDGNGNIMVDEAGNTRYDYGDKANAGLERPVFSNSNALSQQILDTDSYSGNAATASGTAEIRFLKDFKFVSTNSLTMDESRSTGVTNPYYGAYAASNGIVSKISSRVYSVSLQQLLNYAHVFGKHDVEAMVGHESYRRRYEYLYASKNNMFDPANHELAGAVNDGSANSYDRNYNTEGYFGRVQYNYDEKYFGSASFRRDASSHFHPDNRWGNFFSLGAAWLLSKEEWFDVDWVDMLKVKASYGEQGNDNIGYHRYTNTYDIVNASGSPAAIPRTMGNKDITWEKNANFNIGVEFELWKGRLSGSVEYFNRKTSDMLFSFPLPPTFGYTSYYANVGDMRNTGVELELNGDIIRTKDFRWSMSLNMTHYKNEVSYLPDERKTMEVDGVKGYSSGSLYYGEGIPLYTYHMKRYAGVDPETGEALYYHNVTDEAGNVSMMPTRAYGDADYYLCGTSLPDVYGGFSTSFAYKGFDLSVDFAYQIGGQVYDSDYATMMVSPRASSKGYAMHADILNAWTPENNGSNIPRLQFEDSYTASSSDRFLVNASYLSLQNINLGYTFPSKVSRKMGIDKLRLYFTCDNVWIWSKRQGLDPRQAMVGSADVTNASAGFSTASFYAPIRTVTGGITLTF